MSDIKRFLVRMPADLYESLELEAMKLNTSVNSLIVDRISDNRSQTPKRLEAIEKTRKIAAALPNTFAGSDIPTNHYGRRTMGHALNCSCLICKPPRG